jgi:hypothetical protein
MGPLLELHSVGLSEAIEQNHLSLGLLEAQPVERRLYVTRLCNVSMVSNLFFNLTPVPANKLNLSLQTQPPNLQYRKYAADQCVVMLAQDSFYRGLTPKEKADVKSKFSSLTAPLS